MCIMVAAMTAVAVTACTPPETPQADIAEQVTLPEFVFCDAAAAEATPGYGEALALANETIYARDPQGWLSSKRALKLRGRPSSSTSGWEAETSTACGFLVVRSTDWK